MYNDADGKHTPHHPALLHRVEQLALREDFDCLRVTDQELVLPHPPLGETRIRIDSEGDSILRLCTTHYRALGFGEIPELSEFVNDWNHDCLSPQLVLDYDHPTAVKVWGHSFFVVHNEPDTAQLAAATLPALYNAEAYLEELAAHFPGLRHQRPAPLPGSLDEPEDTASGSTAKAEEAEDPVREVSISRLKEMLPSLGISRFQAESEDAIFAWINDVLFAFALDSGPSLIIKGHWDPNLEGSDFSKIFLICNDWNRANSSASAYCHSNVDGLQVRVDYVVMTGAGLSDAQLVSALGRGLKHILHGIDDISHDAVGSSPVAWP